MAQPTVEALQEEVARLSRELDEASSEKIQSAKYGLSLLEEKAELQHRVEELELLYENTQHDLYITREALTKFHNSHKVGTSLKPKNPQTETSMEPIGEIHLL